MGKKGPAAIQNGGSFFAGFGGHGNGKKTGRGGDGVGLGFQPGNFYGKKILAPFPALLNVARQITKCNKSLRDHRGEARSYITRSKGRTLSGLLLREKGGGKNSPFQSARAIRQSLESGGGGWGKTARWTV